MKTKTIVVDWRADADPEAIERKTLEWVDGIYNAGLPYGVERCYVVESERADGDTSCGKDATGVGWWWPL